MIKVLSVIGTRPEAIKMAPVIQELQHYPTDIISKVCVTAQHRQMTDQALALFHIQPDYDLNIMKREQSLTGITTQVLEELEPILKTEQPDWVLAQGDTTTVLATALAASYQRIKVGHVEAGLRTYDTANPFPEEVNRRIADVLADRLFAPTRWAAENLRRESVPKEKIVLTGNTIVDALQQIAERPLPLHDTQLASLPVDQKRIILVTSHRREHLASGIEEICHALLAIAERHSNVHFVFPVHPNPQVREPVYSLLDGKPDISLLEPLDYTSCMWLLKKCYFVMTDSGGLQEEAPCLGKPILVLRDTTERPEGMMGGSAKLVGTNPLRIFREATKLLTDSDAYQTMAQGSNPYGDGRAARRIVHSLIPYQLEQELKPVTIKEESHNAM
ncbi:MAG TPA: UDP-N-acetylglucosamine 2-epimerase (non-hydrolyzing) [Ktedonobacteraceae bacterium]